MTNKMIFNDSHGINILTALCDGKRWEEEEEEDAGSDSSNFADNRMKLFMGILSRSQECVFRRKSTKSQ